MWTKTLVLAAVTLLASSIATPALAAPSPSPPFKYSKTTNCVTSANTRSTLKSGVSWAQTQLDYTALWDLGDKGAGETVAVIDTGVNPVLAFSGRLRSGGDYVVAHGDGQSDCDGHGTVVAGIIAAQPDQTTGFSGVAPAAKILPIRQSSDYYGVKNAKPGSPQETAGNTTTLGEAIRYAVDEGANVINISEASCRNASSGPDETVQADIDYAVRHDVVVVAAAGNVDSSTQCKQQNTPGADPATFPTPAEMKGVLAVGAVDPNGDPAPFSLAGPWDGVAAPGVAIISTNPAAPTGQINEFITSSGVTTIQGTSFAAPYVAGLAALVQERFRNLGALGVIHRIEQTAEHPSAPGERNDYVGYGMIDPAAALTAVLPSEDSTTPTPHSEPSVLPAAAQAIPDRQRTTRLIALISTLGLLVLAASAGIALSTRRRRAEALVRQSRLRPGAGARRGG